MAQVLEQEQKQVKCFNEAKLRVLIDALRNTKVDQGWHSLYDRIDESYCAVGAVLHEVFGFDGYGIGKPDARSWYKKFEQEFGVSTQKLIYLNDLHGKSFTEIADIVESWL